jgi:hypothetical protein
MCNCVTNVYVCCSRYRSRTDRRRIVVNGQTPLLGEDVCDIYESNWFLSMSPSERKERDGGQLARTGITYR